MKTVNIATAFKWRTFGILDIDGKGNDFKLTQEGGKTIEQFRQSAEYTGVDFGYKDTHALFGGVSGAFGINTNGGEPFGNPIYLGNSLDDYLTMSYVDKPFTPPNTILVRPITNTSFRNVSENYWYVDPKSEYSYSTSEFFTNYRLYSKLSPRSLGTWYAELSKYFDATDASGLYTVMMFPRLEKVSFNKGAVFLQKDGDGKPLIIPEGESVGYHEISNMMIGSRVATVSAKYRQLRSKDDINWTKLETDGVVTAKEDGTYTVKPEKWSEYNEYILTLPYVERTVTVDFTYDPMHLDFSPQAIYDNLVLENAVKMCPDYKVDLTVTQRGMASFPYFANFLTGLPKRGLLKSYLGTKLEELVNISERFQNEPFLMKDIANTRWTKSFYQLLEEHPEAIEDKEKLNTLFKQSPEYAYLTSMWHSDVKVPVTRSQGPNYEESNLSTCLANVGIRTEFLDFKNSNINYPEWYYGEDYPEVKDTGAEHQVTIKIKDTPFFSANPEISIEADEKGVISIASSENRGLTFNLIDCGDEGTTLLTHMGSSWEYNGENDDAFTTLIDRDWKCRLYTGAILNNPESVSPDSYFIGNAPEAVLPAYGKYTEAKKLKDTLFFKAMHNVVGFEYTGNYWKRFAKPNNKFNVLDFRDGPIRFGVVPVFNLSEMIAYRTPRTYIEDTSSTTLEPINTVRIHVKDGGTEFDIDLVIFTKFSDAESSDSKLGFLVRYVGARANLDKFSFNKFWKVLAGKFHLRWTTEANAKKHPEIEMFQRSQFKVDDVDVLKLPEGAGAFKEYDESYGESQPIGNFHRMAITESYHAEAGSEAYFIYRPSLNKFTD